MQAEVSHVDYDNKDKKGVSCSIPLTIVPGQMITIMTSYQSFLTLGLL